MWVVCSRWKFRFLFEFQEVLCLGLGKLQRVCFHLAAWCKCTVVVLLTLCLVRLWFSDFGKLAWCVSVLSLLFQSDLGTDLGTSLFLREGECDSAGLNQDWFACEWTSVLAKWLIWRRSVRSRGAAEKTVSVMTLENLFAIWFGDIYGSRVTYNLDGTAAILC